MIMEDITINGITYENISKIVVQGDNGDETITFNETSGATAEDDDVVAGETYYADGEERTGTHECDETNGEGTPGKSAYEIAVDKGFEGDETEWLASLVGPQGPQGIPGENGKSAYLIAKENGYTGTEEEFNTILSMLGLNVANIYIGSTEPVNIICKLWVDNSDSNNIVLKYKDDNGVWKAISSNSNGGSTGDTYWADIKDKPFESIKRYDDIIWDGTPTSAYTNQLNIDLDGTPAEVIYYKLSDVSDMTPNDCIGMNVIIYTGGEDENLIIDDNIIDELIIVLDNGSFTMMGYSWIITEPNFTIDLSDLFGVENSIVTFPETGIYSALISVPDYGPVMFIKEMRIANTIKKISPEFVYNSDWNDFDSESGEFIKNRPFYSIKYGDIKWNGDDTDLVSCEFKFNDVISKCYKIINGDDYQRYGYDSNYSFISDIIQNINYFEGELMIDGELSNTFVYKSESSIRITSNTILYNNIPILFYNYYDQSMYVGEYDLTLPGSGIYFAKPYITSSNYGVLYKINISEFVKKKLESKFIYTLSELHDYTTSNDIPTGIAVVTYVKSYVERQIGGMFNASY